MKNKGILTAAAIFVLLIIIVFLSPFVENKIASTIWFLFFILVGILVILWVLKTSNLKPVENYKKQPKTTQILTIACAISLIYDFINLESGIHISVFVIGISIIIEFFIWFFKKEE